MRDATRDNARGIVLMLGAVLCFTVSDAMAKAIGEATNPVMALWARYAGQMVLVAVLIAPRARAVLRTRYPRLQAFRAVMVLGAATAFFFAITRIGLAPATAIMGLNPVLITLGAALVLGERLGLRRALGIAASLAGALLIIRPGSAVFSIWALAPLGGACCYAAYALATRFIGRAEDAMTSLFYSGAAGGVVFTALIAFNWQTPDPLTIALMIAIGAAGSTAQFLLIRSLMTAEASVVAPFSYAGLIFATLWGATFFGEYPDAPTLIGMGIIALAGLYVWHRETRLAAVPDREVPVVPR